MSVFCPRCAVEIVEDVAKCPLCSSVLVGDQKLLPPLVQAYPREFETFPGRLERLMRHRGLINIISAFVVFVPAMICLAVDFMYAGGGWSLVVIYTAIFLWTLVFIPLAFFRLPLLVAMLLIASAGAYLFILDMLDGQHTWSMTLGWPLLLWVALAIFVLWLGLVWPKKSPGLVAALIFVCLQIITIGTDLSTQYFVFGVVTLTWSLVVVSALMPLALLALLLQFSLSNSSRLKRFFHW